MDFFSKIGSKVSSGASAVANKTKDIAGNTKLKMQISDDEKLISKQFNEIGRKYYKANINNPGAEYEEEFRQIREASDRICAAKAQIEQNKQQKAETVACPKCGANVNADQSTCPCCAAVLSSAPRPAAAFCPNCGKPVVNGAAFCANCGTKIG